VKVTGDPVKVVQTVNGSLPSFSLVVPPAEVVAVTGNVTGIGTEQEFPLAVTVAPVMDLPSLDKVHESLGWHWLRNNLVSSDIL
jgi:hypothetical protein